ncbi:hypothetical protein QBC41DRAFT_357334 [Cercophora samala]|uniref:Uncharacterized protein n=1 Tax=Cercophora samala TaxID=330535 RepID=A0AA39ZAW6_9PEZI|nr:hypothetical protein QBC41DRAFT_357334 [Cercophora samala]
MLESDEPDPDFHDAVDCSITLNKILFHRLQSVRERVRTFTAEKAAAGLDLEQPLLPCGNNQEAYSRLLHAYNELAFELGLEPGLTRAYLKPDINRRIPQPLFGALSLVIRRKEIDPKNLVVADIPVWIHAIRTTLSRAMDFIFSLSAREDAAAGFGPQPDPRLASQDPARIPGWREGCGLAGHLKLDLGGYTGLSPSDLPPGPSSMWVEDITPDMLATHWYAQEQKKIQARQGELPKSLVAIREENERKAALKAMGIVEQRWDKIDPNDLEDWEEQSAYWRRQ